VRQLQPNENRTQIETLNSKLGRLRAASLSGACGRPYPRLRARFAVAKRTAQKSPQTPAFLCREQSFINTARAQAAAGGLPLSKDSLARSRPALRWGRRALRYCPPQGSGFYSISSNRRESNTCNSLPQHKTGSTTASPQCSLRRAFASPPLRWRASPEKKTHFFGGSL